jgi:hypothetical protein
VRGDRLGVLGRVDAQDPVRGNADVETVDEPDVGAIGDDQLAVRVGDVVSQLGPAAGRVDADDRRTGQGGADDPEHVLGLVVEQHADVERARPAAGGRERRPLFALRDDLRPRVALVLEQQPRSVVAGAGPQEIGRRLHVSRPR